MMERLDGHLVASQGQPTTLYLFSSPVPLKEDSDR